VLLIAQDGQIIWSTAKGMADREKGIPNTLQTIYRIGEMTMQFKAAALLLLEQEGKLSLDDPICDYLDDCPEAWQPVTIHHLLSHTSGDPVVLQEGSNGWTCFLDRLVSPGNDPFCDEAIAAAAFTAGTTRSRRRLDLDAAPRNAAGAGRLCCRQLHHRTRLG
jgi:CubicO group peptidase (beta-lactamase class C family)